MSNEIDIFSNYIDLQKITKNDIKKITEIVKQKYGSELLKEIVKDEAINGVKNQIEKNSFDYEKIKNEFIGMLKADNTKKAYLKALSIFENYLKVNDLHILDLKAKEIDLYIDFINKLEKSTSTKRLYLLAVSSFLGKLKRWDYIGYNYFKGCKMPVKTDNKIIIIPKKKDIEKLRNTIIDYKNYTGRGSEDVKKSLTWLLPIFDLIVNYGLRVGAIQSITFHQNNTIKYYSKGKASEKIINTDLYKKIKQLDLKRLYPIKIQKAIETLCKRSDLKFHVHSFRHYFAVNDYKKNKDIYRLKELLNHSSISITENYLKGLKLL